MRIVSIGQAKIHLSKLIREALAGEEIVIARGRNPLVKIVPLEPPRKKRRFGCAKGIVTWIADDFDAPLKEFGEMDHAFN
jgi:prevent-host-death family protein